MLDPGAVPCSRVLSNSMTTVYISEQILDGSIHT